ncbi:MAG TPA: hypothetical protein VK540_11865 [Polyangiaceae bacterium]|jgi:hypothetical protein|nr:hypothetical protein [Polyangiaceae bacterium]
MAGAGVGGVLLLPLVLSVCSSPVSETEGRPRPPEERVTALGMGASGEGKAASERPVTTPAGPLDPRSAPATEAARIRRVEDLPPATPVAYRPLRVEELPQVPPTGKRSRRSKEAPAAGPLRIEDLPSVSAAVRPLRPDELNPELVQRADDLLWNHPAPVGVDVPFEVKGRSYVARFALHYHEFGGDKKPWGYHKGVTLYSTEP